MSRVGTWVRGASSTTTDKTAGRRHRSFVREVPMSEWRDWNENKMSLPTNNSVPVFR